MAHLFQYAGEARRMKLESIPSLMLVLRGNIKKLFSFSFYSRIKFFLLIMITCASYLVSKYYSKLGCNCYPAWSLQLCV